MIFDVGANVGQYARMVRKAMPGGRIFSFEPGPAAFERLKVAKIGGAFVPIQAALGAIDGETVLFDFKEQTGSPHASLIPGVIEEFRGADAQEIKVAMVTLDAFARHRSIDKIDLLKIDVEGAELRVLQGAREMIAARRIQVLQIEMTENNLLSRTFFWISPQSSRITASTASSGMVISWIYPESARSLLRYLAIRIGAIPPIALRGWRREFGRGSSDRRPAGALAGRRSHQVDPPTA